MTVSTLQPRERRLLVLAAVVVAGVLGYVYGIEPFLATQHDVRERITMAEQQFRLRQRQLADREAYLRQADELRAEIAQRRARLLPGDKAPIAASELQKLIKSAAQETGVEVRSERILPTTDRGGYTEVPLEVTLAGPIRALVTFLHQLDAAPVQLSVQDLKLRVVAIGAPKEVQATLALSGYIATGGNGESPPRGEPRRPGA